LNYAKDCLAPYTPVLRLATDEIKCLLSVYPKEWLINEIDPKDDLLKYDFQNLVLIEPPWKLILSNKAILPLLWEMFPNHPNLVPAYYDSPRK
jgi:glutathionylspermidine synthase